MSPASAPSVVPTVIYRRLLQYAQPHWPVFIIAAIGMAFYAATDTGFAWLIKNLLVSVDAPAGTIDPQAEQIRRWLPLGILVLFLVRGIAEFAASYSIGWIGRQVIKQLRAIVFSKFLHLPTRYFDAKSTEASGSRAGW